MEIKQMFSYFEMGKDVILRKLQSGDENLFW